MTGPDGFPVRAAPRSSPARPWATDLRPAGPADDTTVERLFLALHRYNASLDPLFALGPAWQDALRAHLRRVADDPAGRTGLTVLAWSEGQYDGVG